MSNKINFSKANGKTLDNQKMLSLLYDDQFDYQIMKRGINYYNGKNVLAVYKNDDTYYSRVASNDNINKYNVTIHETDIGLEMSCDCPCQYPCKHEYATLLAIDKNDLTDVKLLPEIEFETYNLHDIIEKIPAKDLKRFLLDNVSDIEYIFSNMEQFNKMFSKYLPLQKEEYYYNKLYNMIIMQIDVDKLINEYMYSIKQYVDCQNYNQAFIIIKSLINAFYKTNTYYSLEEIELALTIKLGMYLRIVYRKVSEKEKSTINTWIQDIKRNKFYNDVYLEDMILTLKT